MTTSWTPRPRRPVPGGRPTARTRARSSPPTPTWRGRICRPSPRRRRRASPGASPIPSLFLAPLATVRLGFDDTDAIAATAPWSGTCWSARAQLTGGYFADPGRKDVPGLAASASRSPTSAPTETRCYGKLPGTGGLLDRRTVREQLLYEITRPGAYLTPDVSSTSTRVKLAETHPIVCGSPGPRGGPTGPAQGERRVPGRPPGRGRHLLRRPGCVERARLAGEVVRERLATLGKELRIDVVGSLSDGAQGEVAQCWLRVAGLTRSLDQAADDLPRSRVALHQRTGRRWRRTNAGHRSHRHRLDPDRREAVNPKTTLLETP